MATSVTVTKRYSSITSLSNDAPHKTGTQAPLCNQQRSRQPDMGSMSRMDWFSYHMKTVWLFTKSDMPTSTGINTTFAIAGIFAGSALVTGAQVDWSGLGWGVAVALYFTWHLTLCFNLGNQRQPQSVIEDGANKPWRPIPAGRISPELALKWQLASIASLLVLCVTVFGAWQETCWYLFCTWLYNERAWGDKSWWKRQLMNGSGITTNRAASLRVAITAAQSVQCEWTYKGLGWLLINASIVFTTIQVQDLRDQEGDALIDRQTLPLIIGDTTTRWLTAAAIWFWSVACPLYWGLGAASCVFPVVTGFLVSLHMLIYRTRARDQTSFRLVAAWWISLYLLPTMKAHGL